MNAIRKAIASFIEAMKFIGVNVTVSTYEAATAHINTLFDNADGDYRLYATIRHIVFDYGDVKVDYECSNTAELNSDIHGHIYDEMLKHKAIYSSELRAIKDAINYYKNLTADADDIFGRTIEEQEKTISEKIKELTATLNDVKGYTVIDG